MKVHDKGTCVPIRCFYGKVNCLSLGCLLRSKLCLQWKRTVWCISFTFLYLVIPQILRKGSYIALSYTSNRLVYCLDHDEPIVETADGKIKGVVHYARGGSQPVYAFYGIPYAAPPIGQLRFQHPKAPTKWQGVRDASRLGEYFYT